MVQEHNEKGACISIGSGTTTLVWNDPWIPGNPNFKAIPASNLVMNPTAKVCDLITSQPKCWNLPLLNNLFDGTTIENILRIHLPIEDREDSFIWTPTRSEEHIVKSFYRIDINDRLNAQTHHNDNPWRAVCGLKIH